jgi:hypothetical protein
MTDKILLLGLDEDEAELLLANIPKSDQSRESEELKPPFRGEPATTVIVLAATVAALKAWIAFLALKASKRTIVYKVEICRANGDRVSTNLEISKTDQPNNEKDIIKALGTIGIDTSLLVGEEKNA